MAQKDFAAQVRARDLGVTADVMTRDSQARAGYWEIVQDACADLTRVMLLRCHDEENHKALYDYCRGLRGQIRLAAFPNLFITIAPAEWKFFRPYFLAPYAKCVVAGSYLMALHMYFVVRCNRLFLASKFGNRFFTVLEYIIKTEYQGRGTPHWHIAARVLPHGLLANLIGRTNDKRPGRVVRAVFLKLLETLSQCEIDVNVGCGSVNYITGYVAKDHDAVDVGLGEYTQKGSTAPWLATYRLLCQSSPSIPECAIRMSQLSEFDRS